MNIERDYATDFNDAGRELELLYSTVPRWREILTAVKAGHFEFVEMLAKAGLLDDFGLVSSTVHPYQEIEVHAFILGIPSGNKWEEVQTKSYLTYASHWIDDFFDSPVRVPNPEQLKADRGDICQALANMGPVGNVGFAMANRVRHPEAVYKSLHRMLYGGLVQRASDYAERHALVEEYRAVATRFVDPKLVEKIRELQPEAYWTTNKTVLELLAAAEETVNYDTVELWNLVYAPALYFQDAEAERARGELNFDEHEAPQMSELLRMIDLGAARLALIYDPESLEFRQLEFAALTIPNLPDEVATAYRALWEGRCTTLLND
jgi:hypothetical protein